jgi:hypothetical protein
MTLSEMAAAIGIKSTAALRRLCERGVLPGAELKGKTWFVPVATVEWYRQQRVGKRGRPPKEPVEGDKP